MAGSALKEAEYIGEDEMRFLRNAWYCAAWSKEVSRRAFGRTLLNEKVVLFRKEDGTPVALGDVCPHRFAPMHLGKLHGDILACPYHGLQFGEDGGCRRNPHGPVIPPELRLKSYPLVERHNIVWIWMGDPEKTDQSLIPDFSCHTDPDYATVEGWIHISGSYQLVADNLLDLSHTQFLHPMLTFNDLPEAVREQRLHQNGTMLTTEFNELNNAPSPLAYVMWEKVPERLDSLAGIRWQPPANMLLTVRNVSRDPEAPGDIRFLGAELITPETYTTCHYFWSNSRDFRQEDAALSEQLATTTEQVFTNEDGAMIAHVQNNMGEQTDLIAMRPVVLPTDSAAIRARNILKKLINAEEVPDQCAPKSPV